MKTMIFWLRKGCRKPKMQGLATATCSASMIATFRKSASEKRGRLFIVEAESAAVGRSMIKIVRENLKNPENFKVPVEVLDGGHTILIGESAVQAVSNCAPKARQWDSEIATRGAARWDTTRALNK